MPRQRVTRETYEPSTWRLIRYTVSDGPTNMATDEAILESVAAGTSLPTLRFYGWSPACLSLGRDQEWDAVDVERCAELGWHIVRRPSAGRAILHVDELSYAICAPLDEPRVQGNHLESYKRLAQGLLVGLRSIGLDPSRARPYYEDRGPIGQAMFDGPSEYEIAIGQRKLVASAQAHVEGALLLHGAMPLSGDIARAAEALWFDLPSQKSAIASRLRYRATTLELALGRQVSRALVINALGDGFAQALDLEWEESHLTDEERARAATLRTEKYASEHWSKAV